MRIYKCRSLTGCKLQILPLQPNIRPQSLRQHRRELQWRLDRDVLHLRRVFDKYSIALGEPWPPPSTPRSGTTPRDPAGYCSESEETGNSGGGDGDISSCFWREATLGLREISGVCSDSVARMNGLILPLLISFVGARIWLANSARRTGSCGGAKHRASIVDIYMYRKRERESCSGGRKKKKTGTGLARGSRVLKGRDKSTEMVTRYDSY